MNSVLKYLHSIQPLPDPLTAYLRQVIKRKEIPRKDYLLKEGQVCRNIHFIEKGLLRCYYIKDGGEVSSWFMKEQDVCIAIESYYHQEPSQENIQALEDTVVFSISHEELDRIYRNFPSFNYTGRILTERYYMLSDQRSRSMRMQRSHERYDWLMERYPELMQRVPAKYIASYLGITEVTLSVVRGRK
jgi:CRP-like cAMP-binding protein